MITVKSYTYQGNRFLRMQSEFEQLVKAKFSIKLFLTAIFIFPSFLLSSPLMAKTVIHRIMTKLIKIMLNLPYFCIRQRQARSNLCLDPCCDPGCNPRVKFRFNSLDNRSPTKKYPKTCKPYNSAEPKQDQYIHQAWPMLRRSLSLIHATPPHLLTDR